MARYVRGLRFLPGMQEYLFDSRPKQSFAIAASRESADDDYTFTIGLNEDSPPTGVTGVQLIVEENNLTSYIAFTASNQSHLLNILNNDPEKTWDVFSNFFDLSSNSWNLSVSTYISFGRLVSGNNSGWWADSRVGVSYLTPFGGSITYPVTLLRGDMVYLGGLLTSSGDSEEGNVYNITQERFVALRYSYESDTPLVITQESDWPFTFPTDESVHHIRLGVTVTNTDFVLQDHDLVDDVFFSGTQDFGSYHEWRKRASKNWFSVFPDSVASDFEDNNVSSYVGVRVDEDRNQNRAGGTSAHLRSLSDDLSTTSTITVYEDSHIASRSPEYTSWDAPVEAHNFITVLKESDGRFVGDGTRSFSATSMYSFKDRIEFTSLVDQADVAQGTVRPNGWLYDNAEKVMVVNADGVKVKDAPVATLQVSTTAPTNERGFWFNPTTGNLHIWTED